MKKLLSLALALALCLSLVSVVAAAEEDFYIEDGVLLFYFGTGRDVVIPAGVTEIGQDAFAEADITSVIIPNSVTSIGMGAFYGSSLENVVIPNSVTFVGSMAFQECAQLKSVTIEDGVTYIEPQTFYGCVSLETLHIGSGVEAIGTMAFEHCSSLKTLVIPRNVSFIEDGAFYGCSGLSELTISPNTVCGSSAFAECPALPTGIVPTGTYSDTYGGEEKTVGDFVIHGETLTKYTGQGGNVVIPDGVTTIATSAFHGCTTLKSITIANGVKQVEAFAFQGCTALEEVTIGNGVLGIGNYAFVDCTALKTVTFPASGQITVSLKSTIKFPKIFGSSPLQEIVNCPDNTVYEQLAANERIRKAWTDAGPSSCVLPQSQRIINLSNQICAGQSSDYEKARAIYDWMVANIVYDFPYYYGEKESVTIFPEEVLDSKLTICDGYSRLTQALLQAQDIPALRVTGTADGRITDAGASHAWNMAYVDNRWIYIDSTWGREKNYDPLEGEPEYFTNNSWFDPTPLYFSCSHLGKTSTIDPNGHHDDTPHPTTSNGASSVTPSGGSSGSSAPAVAYPSTQEVEVNGEKHIFECYALKDANGNDTNYIKLRDLADIMNGTSARFNVGWDGHVTITQGQPYTRNGTEHSTPFSGQRPYTMATAPTLIDGTAVDLSAFILNDDQGGGYTYYKLRDLGAALGFAVDWSAERGIYIETK